jgi:Domain of unknown function (DUF4190)
MAPGPYPVPPQQPQMPMLPAPIYAPPSQTDSKAVIALILGIVSMLCCGFGMLFGIPAIVLGAMSKRDINRSGGTLGGDGMAIGGIVTGGISTLISLGYIVVQIVTFTSLGTSSTAYTATPYIPPPTYTTPLTTGAIHATELTKGGGPLKDQLLGEVIAARAAGEKVLVYEYARGAIACSEFDKTLADFEMQRVLANVRLVRVEAHEFPADLPALGMNKASYPWFYKLDTTFVGGKEEVTIADSISGDEWTDNYAWNISPVLEKFLAGTYVKTAPVPTPLPVPTVYKGPPKPTGGGDPGY